MTAEEIRNGMIRSFHYNQVKIEQLVAGNLGETFRLVIPMINEIGQAQHENDLAEGHTTGQIEYRSYFDRECFSSIKSLLYFERGNKAIDLPESAEELLPYLAHEVEVNENLQDGDHFIFENNCIAVIENGQLVPKACHLWNCFGDRHEIDNATDKFVANDDSFANDDPFIRSQLGYLEGHKRSL